MNRVTARTHAMKLIYEWEMGGEGGEDTRIDLLGVQPGEEESAFMERMFSGVVENAAEIDRRIEENARGWKLERISRVDLAILRLATCELMHGKTPQAVVIDAGRGDGAAILRRKIAAVRARRARQHLKEPGAMKCALGVDTSCYTTSVALAGETGVLCEPPPAASTWRRARGAFGSPRPCSSMCSACPR